MTNESMKRDFDILMTNRLLILDDEMSGKSKRDESYIKMILTVANNQVRAAYDHFAKLRRRIANFCGTTNHEDILNDPTGNRRLLPFKYSWIDYEVINKIDRVDLFMEAYHLLKSGFDWQVLGEDIKRLEKLTGDHEMISTEYQVLSRYLSDESPDDYLDFAQCLQYLTVMTPGLKIDERQLRNAFKKKKWSADLRTVAGKTARYYHLRKTAAFDKPGETREPLPF
jgi:predicted P-loop ATPase